MNQKVFIVCLDKNFALNIAKKIVSKDDSYTICPMFTTDKEYDEANENYETYLDVHTINLSYKNNSLLFIKTTKYISTGITIDDFYNNDICIMDINEYNLIAENIFKKYNIITVWIDSKNHKTLSNSDLIEIDYFYNYINNIDYLYFLENEAGIDNVIIDYLKADEEERKNILEENS